MPTKNDADYAAFKQAVKDGRIEAQAVAALIFALAYFATQSKH